MGDPAPDIRASDAERERTAATVREAVADGRLTMVEGDERLAAAYGAVYRGELVPITADLEPAPFPDPTVYADVDRPVASGRPDSTASFAVLSGTQRRGPWVPGRTHRVAVVMGGAELDFRQARLDGAGLDIEAFAMMGGVTIDLRGAAIGAGVDIRAVAFMGGVEVIVDPETTVVETGIGIMGGFEDGTVPPRPPDGPVVRMSGLAVMGGVSVTRKPADAREVRRDDRPGEITPG